MYTMNWSKTLMNYFELRKQRIIKAIESAKKARDDAPSAMESHSDTTRNQNERLVHALESELSQLENLTKNFLGLSGKVEPYAQLWRLVEVEVGGDVMKVCLVPEGLGGEKVKGVSLLSQPSPLGKIIKNKKKGDEFEFNGQKVVIVGIT